MCPVVRPSFAYLRPGPHCEGLRLEADGDSEATLAMERDDRVHRLILHNLRAEQSHSEMTTETSRTITAAVAITPTPIWKLDDCGRLIWANTAFKDISAEAVTPKGASTPFLVPEDDASGAGTQRVSVELPDGARRWFEVTRRPVGDGVYFFATSIDSLVEAEMAQRNFVQTLTKTFAHLPIGLAVFDRERRLVLFNPALVDLTRLPVDFLSSRPNLHSFFDHMRENRMMPEPKNYSSWREKLTDVIAAARDDRYCETWNLPAGVTYKITGRPHPDGAIAFLIEDISAEVSLTRRFRSELELTQSVIDCFDDAVAVFSQLGVLTFCNAAYRSLWEAEPDCAFVELSIGEATQNWQNACEPSPIWADMREFVLTLRDRAAWSAPLVLHSGQELICGVEPVAAGATMIRFTRVARTADGATLLRFEA